MDMANENTNQLRRGRKQDAHQPRKMTGSLISVNRLPGSTRKRSAAKQNSLRTGCDAVPGAARPVGLLFRERSGRVGREGRESNSVRTQNHSPEDVGGMAVGAGHPHRNRRQNFHAAVVARGWGKCAARRRGKARHRLQKPN